MINVNVESKFYGSEKIISDLSFVAAPGEVVALVGPSGTGKSTLLDIIAGLDTSYLGSIAWPSGSRPESDIAYMFQEPRLLPWKTVIENVHLVGKGQKNDLERAKQLLMAAGLAGKFDLYPRQLSGGMQRRVSLARAFLSKPKLVLMDEPFVSLDSPSAEALRSAFLEFWRECGSTVIYVTHDLAEAISISDRILFLSPSPARIILEQEIEDTRPPIINAEKVHILQRQLLEQYPRLLSGVC